LNFAITGFDKAITAAILTAATALVTAAQRGPLGTNEFIAAAVAGVVAGLAVYFKANAAPAPKPAA
jgi:4-amino-4-deoxy-L-arabinose transferase-like glycosyltransferase